MTKPQIDSSGRAVWNGSFDWAKGRIGAIEARLAKASDASEIVTLRAERDQMHQLMKATAKPDPDAKP